MRFGFEDFILDTSRRELTRSGILVVTSPQTFDILKVLIENRDTVVTREQLQDAVWKKRFLSDSTFHSQMNTVRTALSDDGRSQRLIRTVPRKGFRFVGAVTGTATREVSGFSEPKALVTPGQVSTGLGSKVKVGVNPFRNLTYLADLDVFAAGLSDDLLGTLTRIHGVEVQTRYMGDLHENPSEAASRVAYRAGIDFVVEGSVRQSLDQIRVSVQLIDVLTGICVWANRFDGDAANSFGFQDRVLANVATVLTTYFDRRALEQMRISRTGPRTVDEFYDIAMIHVRRGTRESVRRAVPLLLQAMELDPESAKTKSAAAWCCVWLKLLRGMDDAPVVPEMVIELAREAVELECDDPLVLIQSAYALGHFEGDLGFTLGLFDRALALEPADPVAWSLSGAQLISAGDVRAGLERTRRAMNMGVSGPELGNIAILNSLGNLIEGDLGTARKFAREAMSLLPRSPQSSAVLASSLALSGDREEAEMAMRVLRTLSPDLRASGVPRWVNLQEERDLAIFREGLLQAGLPR